MILHVRTAVGVYEWMVVHALLLDPKRPIARIVSFNWNYVIITFAFLTFKYA